MKIAPFILLMAAIALNGCASKGQGKIPVDHMVDLQKVCKNRKAGELDPIGAIIIFSNCFNQQGQFIGNRYTGQIASIDGLSSPAGVNAQGIQFVADWKQIPGAAQAMRSNEAASNDQTTSIFKEGK